MGKIKDILSTHYAKLRLFFLTGIAIATLTSIRRADYNFVLYLYLMYTWNYMENSTSKQLAKSWAFFGTLYSVLIDFIWCLFWESKWGGLSEDHRTFSQSLVTFLSWVGILVKVLTLSFIAVVEWDSIKQALPGKIGGGSKATEFVPQLDEI